MRNTLLAMAAVIGLGTTTLGFAAEPTDMDGANTPNGKIAVGYMNETFNGDGPQAAAQKYFSTKVVSHGNLGAQRPSNAAGGSAPPAAPPGAATIKRSMSIKKVLVQGDLVFIQGHGTRDDKNDLQWELFRIKDGKIVEIWNTHNEIPNDQMGKQW